MADGVGIGREVIVNAYQYGMGLLPSSTHLPHPCGSGRGENGLTNGCGLWPLVVLLAVVAMVF